MSYFFVSVGVGEVLMVFRHVFIACHFHLTSGLVAEELRDWKKRFVGQKHSQNNGQAGSTGYYHLPL